MKEFVFCPFCVSTKYEDLDLPLLFYIPKLLLSVYMNNGIILEPPSALTHLFLNLHYQYYKKFQSVFSVQPISSLEQNISFYFVFKKNAKVDNNYIREE